jgi:hypothetical protein
MRIPISILILFCLGLFIACNSTLLPKSKVIKDASPQLYYRYVNTDKNLSFDYPWYGHRFFKKLDKRAVVFTKNVGIKTKDILFYESTYLSHHLRMMAILYENPLNNDAILNKNYNLIKKNRLFSNVEWIRTPSVKLDSAKENLMTWNDYRIRLDSNIAISQFKYNAVLDKNDFLCNEYYVILKDKSLLRLVSFVNCDTTLFDDTDRRFDTAWFHHQANLNLAFLKQPIPPLVISTAITEPFKLASETVKKGHPYLAPVQVLKRDSAVYDSVRHEFMGMYHQAMMTYYAQAGFNEEAMAMRDTAMGYSRPDSCEKSTFAGYKAEDAIDFISKELPKRHLVMMNEAHHSPMNRLFVMKLLDSLKKNGFKYLALETLSKKHTVNKLGFPTFDDGFYSREPMYGELIRQAKSKGFEVVAYDGDVKEECIPPPDAHRFYCHNIREQRAAENINKVFKKDAKAKVFVLVGHDHNYKNYLIAQRHRRDGQKWKYLAIVLKEMTGHDPLSINQSDMMERSLREYESPFYRCVWLTFTPDKPVILSKNGQSWIKPEMETMIDAYVFHPRTSYETPYEWLDSIGYGQYNLDLKEVKEPHFIQVFYANELKKMGQKAIPALNMPTYDEPKMILRLRHNQSYILKIYGKNGQLLKEDNIAFQKLP